MREKPYYNINTQDTIAVAAVNNFDLLTWYHYFFIIFFLKLIKLYLLLMLYM